MWAITTVQQDYPTFIKTELFATREEGALELIEAYRVFAPTNAAVRLELHGHGRGYLDAVHSHYYLSEVEPIGGLDA